jgi:hypothetical protein
MKLAENPLQAFTSTAYAVASAGPLECTYLLRKKRQEINFLEKVVHAAATHVFVIRYQPVQLKSGKV